MKISVCMMVKDEEHNLPRCLDSIKDYVDEIVIVDTGSSDKTVEIAKSYGAEIYYHPWQNDFSLHRNQSIGYATGDWLFILDADEEVLFDVTPEQFKEGLEASSDSGYDAISLKFNDMQGGLCVMNFNSHRIFKKGKIQYKNIVHNKACYEGESLLMDKVAINHYGYDLQGEAKEKKYLRSKELLLKRAENPDDIEALFYLNQLESVMENREEAIHYGKQYIEECDARNIAIRGTIHFTVYRACFELGKLEEAKEILINRVNNINPDEPDIDIAFAFVELGMQMNDFDMIDKGVNKYLELYEKITTNKVLVNSFTFTLNAQSLIFVLYGGSLLSGYAMLNHLKGIRNLKPHVDQGYAQGLIENINQNFKMLGFNSFDDILFKCQQ